MTAKISQDPWGDFWALNSRSGAQNGAQSAGCLPQRWAAIETAQQSAWHKFVTRVSMNAKVLDLATGDGRVLRWLLSKRPDLELKGIDLAPKLPPAPVGTHTQGGVAMESLPFPDASFDAVVSQFGFEYGNPVKVSSEIARVLANNGKVGLMVHRGDGPILAHNRKRRTELLWALKEKNIAKKVKTVLKQGSSEIDRAAQIAAKIAQRGAEKFGANSPAWEIPEAIHRSCLMGRQAGPHSIIETITIIESHAANELGRINSLSSACKTADSRKLIVDVFAKHGLSLIDTAPITEPSGKPLADFITFG